MKFSNIHLYFIVYIFLVICTSTTTKAQVLNAGQCNTFFKIGLRTLKSSRRPQKITYHGKKFELYNCIGIPEKSSSVQCSFVYRKCINKKCDAPDFRYYSFTYKRHVKGSTHHSNHKCVMSRIIKSLDDPHEVSTAEMGNSVLVESKFDVGNGQWKYSYDKFKVAEYKYIDMNYWKKKKK